MDGERRGVDPFKAKVFQEMEAPKTGKGVQAILGFINFLRDYIPLYASLAAPLESLRNTKVITEELWEESGAREAFERLKEVLSNAPVLHAPDFDLPFIMESDASQYGVGVVLLQEVGPKKEKRYVDFVAKALSKSQEKYPAAKRELLGGLFGMKRWRSWLLFNKFTWGMDSKAMTYINSSTHRTVLNWIYLFAEFDFETSFKKGILNVLPDSLSRLYDSVELDFGRGVGRGEEEEEEQKKEKVKSGVVMLAGVGRKYKVSKERFLWECENKTQLEGEDEKKKEMLKQFHKENHAGVAVLFKTVWEEGFWWPTLWDDCEKEIAKCKECKLFNVERGGFHLLKTILADKPMDHVIMDFAGPFKTSEGGYCFVLIIVDVLTRFCWLRPLMRRTAEDVAYILSEVFANFGVPKIVQSDNDPSFCNQVVEEFRGLAGFEHRRIMAYFPRTNGPVESWVRQTKDLLKKWMVGSDVEWPKYISAIQMSLNDKICSRHGSRPFDVMFGRRMNGFDDYREVSVMEGEEEVKGWLYDVQFLAEDVWPLIRGRSDDSGFRSVSRGNKKGKRRIEKVEVGQLVLREKAVKKDKMSPRWEGPFVVVSYDEGKKGYKLKEAFGKERLVTSLCPIERLKIVDVAFSEEEDDGLRYEVDKIVSHGKIEGEMHYKMKWVGFEDMTWEPRKHFDKGVVYEYWLKVAKKGKKVAEKWENEGKE